MPTLRKKPPWGEGFGERLREAIDQLGGRRGKPVEQRQVAAELGVDEATLSHWASGGVPFAWDRLRKLCEVTGTSADWLLGLSATDAALDSTARSTDAAKKRVKGGGARPTLVGQGLRSLLDVEFDEFEARLLKVLREAVRAELEAARAIPTKG